MTNDILAPISDVDEAELSGLHARLVRTAATEGVLDVAYRTVDSPIGPLLVAATPRGLVRVAFESEDHDAVLARLAVLLSPRVLRAPVRLDTVARQLDEYFDGRRRAFELDLDLVLSKGFRHSVLQHLTQIRYGTTETYSQVASAVGSPRAVRAVGSACATNPLPVVVPCHRVLRSDGGLGGYLAGVDTKATLLALEHAR